MTNLLVRLRKRFDNLMSITDPFSIFCALMAILYGSTIIIFLVISFIIWVFLG